MRGATSLYTELWLKDQQRPNRSIQTSSLTGQGTFGPQDTAVLAWYTFIPGNTIVARVATIYHAETAQSSKTKLLVITHYGPRNLVEELPNHPAQHG